MKKCNLCQKVFPNNYKLTRHMAVHEKPRTLPRECKICFKSFKNTTAFNEHVLRHSNRRNFKCETCSTCFKTPQDVIVHQKIHSDTRTRPFKCNKCPKTFFTKQHVKNHQSLHSTEKPFPCTVCKMSYKAKRRLKDHMISAHSSDNRFDCKFCLKKLSSQSSLTSHMQLHTGENKERTIKCEFCSKLFMNKGGLKFHKIQCHSTNPMFVCKLCSKAYRSKSGLRGHVNRIHKLIDTEKRIPCPLCDLLFLNNGRLNSHMQSHTRPHKCPLCPQAFDSKAHVNIHIRRIHVKKKLDKCYFCGKCYFSLPELSSHMRNHTKEMPLKCDQCNKSFRWEHGSISHKKIHLNPNDKKAFKCAFCPKVFNFQNGFSMHMSRHLNERPFKCALCDASFVIKSEMISHSKSGLCIVRIKRKQELSRGCYFCGKVFRGTWEQSTHLITVHTKEEPAKCSRCEKRFHCNSTCARHMKTCKMSTKLTKQ